MSILPDSRDFLCLGTLVHDMYKMHNWHEALNNQ